MLDHDLLPNVKPLLVKRASQPRGNRIGRKILPTFLRRAISSKMGASGIVSAGSQVKGGGKPFKEGPFEAPTSGYRNESAGSDAVFRI
jgi:hypothetical protein